MTKIYIDTASEYELEEIISKIVIKCNKFAKEST